MSHDANAATPPEPLLTLNEKVAVVTGAASGIGTAIVAALARAGARVVVADIDSRAGESTAKKLAEEGLRVVFRPLDVSDESDWQALVSETVSREHALDILVNNAGIYAGELLTDTTLEELRRVCAVNIEGTFLGMKHAARTMRPSGKAGRGGSIINISSVAGMTGTVGHSAYGASKGAVRALSRHGAIEFAALNYGIRVNSVHPGIVRTGMGDQALRTFAKDEFLGNLESAVQVSTAMIPMKRLGEPHDVASVVLFLASDAAAYITGAEFVVDGGYSAR